MSEEALSAIKSKMTHLNAKELKNLVITAQEMRNSIGLGTFRNQEELLYDVITTEFKNRLGFNLTPLPVLEKKNVKDFKKLKEITQLMDDWAFSKVKMDGNKRRRFYRFCVQLIIEEVQATGSPLSLKSVLESFLNLPGIVDKHFPGYLEEGILFNIV